MVEERVKRRLAAILAADVVGYSRLMEQNEKVALATLKVRRKEILEPLIARYRGRTFKVTGDGVLVEFGSTVDAVECAIEIQREMAAAIDASPAGPPIILRIGINLGDVILEEDDLFGDGVNIAARLEALAEPGGILISGSAYEQVRNKVETGFDDLGVQSLKNIQEGVRAYRRQSPRRSHRSAAAITEHAGLGARLPRRFLRVERQDRTGTAPCSRACPPEAGLLAHAICRQAAV